MSVTSLRPSSAAGWRDTGPVGGGDAVRAAASALNAHGERLRLAAARCDAGGLGPSDWRGSAADEAARRSTDLVRAVRRAAESWDDASGVLRSCAGLLDEAEVLRQQGEALLASAHAPGSDERSALAVAADRRLAEAQALRRAAQHRAAAQLRELTPARPQPHPHRPSQLLGFVRGVRDGVLGVAEVCARTSLPADLLDPGGSYRFYRDTAASLAHDVVHPRDLAAHVLGLDLLRSGDYGEWAGGLVAGAAIPGGRFSRFGELGARPSVRRVDRGGPVLVRLGVSLPVGFPQHIKDLLPHRRRHILDGDGPDHGGGHRAGTGKPDKSEFPASWSDDDIIDRVMRTAMSPEHVVVQSPDRFQLFATHDDVTIKVVISNDGHVVTAHPLHGPGVVRNPPRGAS
jgi:hypothetical protein